MTLDPAPAMTIGMLHPGEMGAAVAAQLREAGHTVLWASAGRSPETRRRARQAGLTDARTAAEVADSAEVIISVCPPHAAVEMAGSIRGFAGIYLDANAISPMTAREIAPLVKRYVDGGIVGAPPTREGTTRLYLSGPEAQTVARLFQPTVVTARVLDAEFGTASALKLSYAAWTKGSQALLLAIRAVARANGVEPALLQEWRQSQPALADRCAFAGRSALGKGWRWTGEMEQIADMFAAAGLPEGFHRAAAEIYARSSQGAADASDRAADSEDALDRVLVALLADEERMYWT